MERQKIEQEYWRRHGAEFKIVFRTDLNSGYARNVETVMAFYNPRFVHSEEDMLKFPHVAILETVKDLSDFVLQKVDKCPSRN